MKIKSALKSDFCIFDKSIVYGDQKPLKNGVFTITAYQLWFIITNMRLCLRDMHLTGRNKMFSWGDQKSWQRKTFDSLPLGKFFMLFHCLLIFFSKSLFYKKNYSNTIWVSNSLDPDQAWCFVRPGLDPNCLRRLSEQDTGTWRQWVKQQLLYTVDS